MNILSWYRFRREIAVVINTIFEIAAERGRKGGSSEIFFKTMIFIQKYGKYTNILRRHVKRKNGLGLRETMLEKL